MQEYTSTPDFYNDYISHYGVKGMKWGKRKAVIPSDMNKELDPRYQKGYSIRPGDERRRLDRLNPAGSRVNTKVVKKKATTTATTSSGSSSGGKGKKGGSKKAVKDILSRFKLTKGGKAGSSSKSKESTKKASSEKKESTKKASSEKKESTKSSEESTQTKKAAATTTTTRQTTTTRPTAKQTQEANRKLDEVIKEDKNVVDSKTKTIAKENEEREKLRRQNYLKRWSKSTRKSDKKVYPRS